MALGHELFSRFSSDSVKIMVMWSDRSVNVVLPARCPIPRAADVMSSIARVMTGSVLRGLLDSATCGWFRGGWATGWD
jgi:hypothetical protein